MLVDAIAGVILAGMMLIPLINLIVGTIVGASLGGAPGIVVGVLLALGITAAQSWYWRRLEWPGATSADADDEPAIEVTMSGAALALDGPLIDVPTLRTGPATARRTRGRSARPEAYHRAQNSSSAPLRRAR